MRQKEQLVIVNDFNVVVFSRNPKVRWMQPPANACSLTYVWHFSDGFLWENYSTRRGGHHHEQTTGNITLRDHSLKLGLGCWGDKVNSAFRWMDHYTAYQFYQNQLSRV